MKASAEDQAAEQAETNEEALVLALEHHLSRVDYLSEDDTHAHLDAAASPDALRPGWTLPNLRERIARLNGKKVVESGPSQVLNATGHSSVDQASTERGTAGVVRYSTLEDRGDYPQVIPYPPTFTTPVRQLDPGNPFNAGVAVSPYAGVQIGLGRAARLRLEASLDPAVPATSPIVYPEVQPASIHEVDATEFPELLAELSPEFPVELSAEVVPANYPGTSPELVSEFYSEVYPAVPSELSPAVSPEVQPEVFLEVHPATSPEVFPEIHQDAPLVDYRTPDDFWSALRTGVAPPMPEPDEIAPAPAFVDEPPPPSVSLVTPSIPPAPVASPFIVTPTSLPDDTLLRETTKHLKYIGAVNILIAGQTGVGKSTLVNAVFGEAFAPTASGRPVTKRPEWYGSDTVPLRILDTQGLEAKHYGVTLEAIQAEIENSRAQIDDRNQLHMAWVCIATPSSRVQDCEIDIVQLLNKHQVPTILVLTKDDDDDEFAPIVAQIMRDAGAKVLAIVPVRALEKPRRPAVGLGKLVTATFRALPVAHRLAFAASQRVNRDLNRSTADDYVTAAASAAVAAAVVPVPFADLATLAPIQASMLVGISNAFGVTLERSQIKQLLTTVLGCLAVTMAGGWAVGTILKFIPGPGTLVGTLLNAGVAGGLTRMLGKAYIRFLHSFLEANGRLPSPEEIFQAFPKFFRAGQKGAIA